jgi:hypothetical protein
VRRVQTKEDPSALPKKSRALSLQIRDVKRLLDRYKDDESQKNLGERLERLLRRSDHKAQRKLETSDAKRHDDQTRKARFLELKKLEKRLKKTEDEDVKALILNDIEYIKTFPRGLPYLSLFTVDLDDEMRGKRDELRKKAAIRRLTRATDEKDDSEPLHDDFFAEEAEHDDSA